MGVLVGRCPRKCVVAKAELGHHKEVRQMDQVKIGSFLQKLRKEKGITQEQLAEAMMVSRRTVSRWETGSNLPDVELLVEIADFYEVDLREIFNGERKDQNMNQEIKETAILAADYSSEQYEKFLGNIKWLMYFAAVMALVNMIISFVDPQDTSALFDFFYGFTGGVTAGSVWVAALILSNFGRKLFGAKQKLVSKIKS